MQGPQDIRSMKPFLMGLAKKSLLECLVFLSPSASDKQTRAKTLWYLAHQY